MLVSICCSSKWSSYTYIHSFLDFVTIKAITEYWIEFPVLYSRFLLVIYFIYNSLYMSIPISRFIPPLALSPLHSVTQSCLTLCDPMDCSLLGPSVHGISQARILEWVATSYSRGSSRPRDRTCVSCVSCIGRRILYHWAIREAPSLHPW